MFDDVAVVELVAGGAEEERGEGKHGGGGGMWGVCGVEKRESVGWGFSRV